MTPFEVYHPLMSQNLVFDWLTTFPLKAVFQLQHDASLAAQKQRAPIADMTTTARSINQMMHHVMRNECLVWGVGLKPAKQLLGFVQLIPNKSVAQVALDFLPTYQTTAILKETLQRVGQLAFHEFDCTVLQITLQSTETHLAQQLMTQGFAQHAANTYQITLTAEAQ
jgi:RimJ/RimL family protein N-acetyltransferase